MGSRILRTKHGRLIVDPEVFGVIQFLSITTNGKYPCVCLDGEKVYLHELVAGKRPEGCYIDHINNDVWDCRVANLRWATPSQNSANRKKSVGKSSRYKGVTALPSGKYKAQIQFHGKKLSMSFDTELAAAAWYKDRALELHGEFSNTDALNEELEVSGDRDPATG